MLPIIGLIAIIVIVLFIVFSAKRKNRGQDLGDPNAGR
jgi:uncharacterized membrane protein